MSANKMPSDFEPTKRRASFRKSDFVIRSKNDDSFSQIDSFKVTAKKPSEPVQHTHGTHPHQMTDFPGNPAMPAYPVSPMMQGYNTPVDMSLAYQQTHYNQQMQAAPWMQSQMASQMPSQAHFMSNNTQGQPNMMSNQMQGQQFATSSQAQGGRAFFNQMHGQTQGLANQGFGMAHELSNQMQHPVNQIQAQANILPNQMQSTANVAYNAQVPHSQPQGVSMQNFSWGQPIVSSGPQASQAEDEFSDFSQAPSVAPEAAIRSEVSVAGKTSIGISAQAQPLAVPVNNAESSSVLPSGSSNSTTGETFQGFASFEQSNVDTDNDFAEFNSFAEVSPDSATPQLSKAEPSDEFGDFGSFEQTSAADSNLPIASKPLPASLDGKRMNIVVKKNVAATSVGSVTKERPVPQGPSTTKLSNIPARVTSIQAPPKLQPPAVPGLNNLAKTLAQATTQLSAPVVPPPEEQKDFSILQEVINSLDKTTLPPIVNETDSSFTLPDTPTQLEQMFPRCAPKRASEPDNADSFQEFAAFSSVAQENHQPAGQNESFGGFADFSSSDNASAIASAVSNPPDDQSLGGFADFSTAAVSSDPDDGFGDFSTPTVSNPIGPEVKSAATSGKVPAMSQQSAAVKSRAVDWSAFSALDDLRAEEEEGNLGDFSVFGSTLKSVSDSEEVKQPNFLLSPDEKPLSQKSDLAPSNQQQDLFGSANQQSSLFDSANQLPSLFDSANENKTVDKQEEDDWAEFSEPAPSAETFAAASPSEDSWEAFSEPAPAAPPIPDTPATQPTVPPVSKSVLDLKLDSGSQFPVNSGMPRVSSKSSFDKQLVSDAGHDNDSDWSGFAEPTNIQPDNISSDWSFKDNGSVHDEIRSVSSSGMLADLSKTNANWSESAKTNSDWTTEVPSLSSAQSPGEDDEWEAFGAINRTVPAASSDSESRSRSSTVKASVTEDISARAAKDMTAGAVPDNGANFTFSSSLPPFSLNTPATPVDFNFHSAQTEQPEHKKAANDDVNDWSDFGKIAPMADQPPVLDFALEVTLSSLPVKSSIASDSAEFATPPVGEDSQEWEDNSRGVSESSEMFTPPPLTDGDFSPHKSVTRAESDWFSFSAPHDSPSSSSFGTEGLPPLPGESSISEPPAEEAKNAERSTPDDTAQQLSDYTQVFNSSFDQLEVALPNPDQLEVAITNNTHSDSDQSREVLQQLPDLTLEEENDGFSFHQPPPLMDDTPGDEMPSFGIPHSSDLVEDNEVFGKFDSSMTPGAEEDFGGFGTLPAEPSSDQSSINSSLAMSSLPGGQTFTEEEPRADNSREVTEDFEWGFQADEQKATGEGEESWGHKPSPSVKYDEKADAVGEDWAFGNESKNDDGAGSSNIPETSSITSGDMAGDWTFQSTNDAAEDDDKWSFKSPTVRSPVSSPPPLSPSAGSTSPAADADDADFGDFPDDDFQDFGETAEVAPPTSVSHNVQAAGDKVSIFLNSAFQLPSAVQPLTTSADEITDYISRNRVWGSLRDLNQSVSLQLQWKDSECHSNLLNSLHIPMTSADGLMGGGLQPVPIKSSNMMQPSSLLPSLTPQRVTNGNAFPSSQKTSTNLL